ncbi:sulfotransferase [Candidatus Woesearchaeota archaeon]|nr:sulfotransferase [Candidatus Woesearchaeota archaeon]
MRKPSLFIVGAPKCGTTTLYDLLSQHPDVFMTVPKEPMHFCKDFIRESDWFWGKKKYFPYRDRSRYWELFSEWSDEKVAGEASTVYLYSKVAAKRIRHFNPEARIIIMLREPVSFIESLYLHNRREAGEVRSLREALDLEPKRKWNHRLAPSRIRFPSYSFYREFANFPEQVRRFTAVFPREQILFITLDELKSSPENVLERVCRFVGVSPSRTSASPASSNTRRLPKSQALRKVLESPLVWQLPKMVLPRKWYDKLKDVYRGAAYTLPSRSVMESDLVESLRKEFKPVVRELSKITAKDLEGLWSYRERKLSSSKEDPLPVCLGGTLGDTFIVFCKITKYWQKHGGHYTLRRFNDHKGFDKPLKEFFKGVSYIDYLPSKSHAMLSKEIYKHVYLNADVEGGRGTRTRIKDSVDFGMEPFPDVPFKPKRPRGKHVGVQLHAGKSLNNYKGFRFSHVLRFMSEHPGATFHLFGTGYGYSERSVRRFCRKHGIRNHVGRTSFSEWLRYLKSMDFLYTPEGFSAFFSLSQKVPCRVYYIDPLSTKRIHPAWKSHADLVRAKSVILWPWLFLGRVRQRLKIPR